jgi:hypothetical protein
MYPLQVDIETVNGARYLERVDQWVRRSVGVGVSTCDALISSLPGVYPTSVLESIDRQGLRSQVGFPQEAVGFGYVLGEDNSSALQTLPTPHPLDLCWWFAPPTVRALIALSQDLSSEHAHVVLLGIPTVSDAAGRSAQTRSFSLIDADPLVVRRIARSNKNKVLHADLGRDALPSLIAHLVIADPPWYDYEMRAFLWAARHLCHVGGYVLTSVPPIGTRPGVEREWSNIVQWSEGLGLRLSGYQQAMLSYVSPPFEENALMAAGVPKTSSEWRRGDLATFQCVDSCRQERPTQMGGSRWWEQVINDVRIRVRRNGERSKWTDPTLKRIAESDILPTVSRRDWRRETVDVWTSGNRVFACAGTSVVIRVLRAIAARRDAVSEVRATIHRPLTLDEEKKVRGTEATLHNIVQTERAELSAWKERHARVDVVRS